MAQRSGLSHNTVSRIWRAFGLQPHRTETFKLSSDPFFIEKVRDVVGLIPESTGSGVGPVRGREVPDPGVGSHPSRYCPCARDKWNGAPMITCVTAPLRCSPALDTRTGKVIGRCHQRHRAVEFRKFPRYHRGRGARRPRRPPDRGQLRHPQDGADPELVCQAAPLPYALHTHQRLVAEPGGALVRSAHRKAVAPRRASEQSRTGDCHLPLPGRHQRRPQTFCLDQDRRPNPGQPSPTFASEL